MTMTILGKALGDNRRALIGWAVGSTGVGVMYASFYPQLTDGAMLDAVAGYPEAMREALRLDDLTSAAGYLQSSVFGLLLPLLMMLYGVFSGARAIAGDEESGQLDLLLAHPVTRSRLLLERFAATATGAVVIAAAVWLAMLAIRGTAQLETISPGEFAAQCMNLALLGVTFGALAIGIGAATGRRATTLGAGAAVGVLAYAAATFGPQTGLDWAATMSPFHYYIDGEPLKNGFQWADAAVLSAASAALVAVGAASLNRRDLAP